jgi:hypothetical protein
MTMMTEKVNYTIEEVVEVTKKSLSKPGFESLASFDDVISLEALKNYLKEKIAEMMEKNFDKLINSLYMIDIDEEKAGELFSSARRENIPEGLASLIIERQLQKVYYRNKYKNENI